MVQPGSLGPTLRRRLVLLHHRDLLAYIHFPADTEITTFCGNNAAAILQPDNVTPLQMQPLYPCANQSALFAFDWCLHQNVSILGDGAYGCHGSSHLSSIGGSIRIGELVNNASDYATMRHSLQLELFVNTYYYGGYDAPCYQWPAMGCDAYHHDNSRYLELTAFFSQSECAPDTFFRSEKMKHNLHVFNSVKIGCIR